MYAADDAKVEIWSYSLNERIEHRSIEVGKSNAIGGAQFTVIFPVDEVKDE